MANFRRFAACAVFVVMALCASAQGQALFNGTWHFDMSKTKFSPKPFIFYTSQGWFHCVSCSFPYDVQADGQDHATADTSVDTYAVTLPDDHTIHIVGKKGGKVVADITGTLSKDGKTLDTKSIMTLASGAPATVDQSSKRLGTLPGGVHPTSGNWVGTKGSGNDTATTVTFKVDGDQLSMNDPAGESYTAKLDGTDATVTGSVGWDGVSLKRVDDHTIEETDKFGGKITGQSKWTVNGKSLTQVVTQQPSGLVSTYFATKQ